MPDDIVSTLIAKLETEWVAANTGNITPVFNTGWLDPQTDSPDQVAVSYLADETAVGGSGVDGLDSSGKALQRMRGMIFVECYAEVASGSTNPKGRAYSFVREVQRIIMDSITGFSGFDYVSFLGMNQAPRLGEDRPGSVRYSCRIGYQWRST